MPLKIRLEKTGKIRLPKNITELLDIQRGDILELSISDDKIILKKAKEVEI